MPNPVPCSEDKGWRNFACPHYADCLDQAALAKWDGFSCKGCAHEDAVRADWEEEIRSDQEGLSTLAATIISKNAKAFRAQMRRK